MRGGLTILIFINMKFSLIKTKNNAAQSGKKVNTIFTFKIFQIFKKQFAQNANDWVFWNPSVPVKI